LGCAYRYRGLSLAQADCTIVYIDLFLVSFEGYHIFIAGLWAARSWHLLQKFFISDLAPISIGVAKKTEKW